nr:immunoglobulin light chain junction region [Macaca mulatta]
CQDYNSRPYSF